ncbi:hypothetical protein [Apilactobacillus xinyiensis]|uniref:hypothetical protein n=1 Tax=Apilactobacillus xinyiensis TaxID=2841032 RepID=UPI00200FD582|nr:hypothetical protein [Apilactobacillus xinyiensis]MCL0330563.1 hypothetical protein [Apilactobacillus xinyiensis]
METSKLLNKIKGKGLSVRKVVEIMNDEYGIKMDISTFYKKLKDVEQFRAYEIRAISSILNLSFDEAGSIFFKELVS